MTPFPAYATTGFNWTAYEDGTASIAFSGTLTCTEDIDSQGTVELVYGDIDDGDVVASDDCQTSSDICNAASTYSGPQGEYTSAFSVEALAPADGYWTSAPDGCTISEDAQELSCFVTASDLVEYS